MTIDAQRHQEAPCHGCGSYTYNATRINLNKRARGFYLCNKCEGQLKAILIKREGQSD